MCESFTINVISLTEDTKRSLQYNKLARYIVDTYPIHVVSISS